MPATDAFLNQPQGVAVDAAGNDFIADTQHNLVRRIAAATGLISTVAGDGTFGSYGDGGPGTSATWRTPSPMSVRPHG